MWLGLYRPCSCCQRSTRLLGTRQLLLAVTPFFPLKFFAFATMPRGYPTWTTKQWKRVIRVWEGDFERQTGSPPGVSDKQIVRSYYEYYRRLRDVLTTGS